MRTMALVLGLPFVLLAGCGSDGGMPPDCTGASCTCPAGEACDFSESSCGAGSCSLACTSDNVCNGTCDESCSIDCAGGSTCTVTVGPSGSVSCSDGSTCHVTCTGSCSVTCGGGSTCDLTCSGQTEAQSIPQGGGCE